MSGTYVKHRAGALIVAVLLVSVITGCAKVTLINKKAKLRAQNAAAVQIMPVPGFAIVSGGGFAQGEGLSVRATVGESTGQALQSGTNLNLWSGIQSTISH